MSKPTGDNSAHDHGNCMVCDYQESKLAALTAELAGLQGDIRRYKSICADFKRQTGEALAEVERLSTQLAQALTSSEEWEASARVANAAILRQLKAMEPLRAVVQAAWPLTQYFVQRPSPIHAWSAALVRGGVIVAENCDDLSGIVENIKAALADPAVVEGMKE